MNSALVRLLPSIPVAMVTIACGTPERPEAETTRASRPESGFEVGAPFPALAFPALEDGTPRSIADFRGKKLILHVFASW